MGKRFSFSSQIENMDLYLKSHLASLTSDTLSKSDKEKIQESIQSGKSYWFYTLEDSRKHIKATYIFQGIQVDGHNKTILQLSFEYLPSFEAKDKEQEKIEKRLLPQ